ncbi:MAG: hypothetical protein ACK4VY_06870 [Brevundimonas sp.]
MISSRTKVLVHVGACVATIVATATPGAPSGPPSFGPSVVAAVFPPWWSAERIRRAVDPLGAVGASGRLPTLVTVYGGRDLERNLRTVGAWFILKPRRAGVSRETAAA